MQGFLTLQIIGLMLIDYLIGWARVCLGPVMVQDIFSSAGWIERHRHTIMFVFICMLTIS